MDTLTRTTDNDFTLDGTWGVVGILPGGFLMSNLDLALWKMKGANPDFDGQVPSGLAVVRARHLNIVLEAGKVRPSIDLKRMGADLLMSEDITRASYELAIKLLNRADTLADQLSRPGA